MLSGIQLFPPNLVRTSCSSQDIDCSAWETEFSAQMIPNIRGSRPDGHDPGHRGAPRHVIFDDKCDESVGSDIVVSAMAAKDTYVAIGGMGHFAVKDKLDCRI